jgi:sugar lactone lactonase YvrE
MVFAGSNASTQIITTVAGIGINSFSGDNGPATSAELSGPNDVIFDVSGNMYIADQDNNRVRKVNSSGTIITIAGTGAANYTGDGGQASAATFNQPTAFGFDSSGNLYIADYNNQVVRRINSSSVVNRYAGTGAAGYNGNGGQATSSQLNYPSAVIADSAGNIYIADSHNNVIREVSTSGVISTYAGNLTAGFSGDGGSATAAELHLPYRIAFDTHWNMYIADSHNNCIRKVDAGTHIISTVAGNGTASYGGDGGPATSAQINEPFGVCVDASGNIYIADTYNNRIRKVNTSGIISTIAGNGTGAYNGDGIAATSAEIDYPTDVTLDHSGNLYISDYYNYRIRKVTIPTSINEISNSTTNVEVYPNPGNGVFTFQVRSGELKDNSIINIYNLLGEKVYSQSNTQNPTFNINLSSHPNGVYLYRILTETGFLMSSGKFVIQK